MSGEEEKVDYLEVDDPIPGQNWVCLSFVSPESMIESKESFKVAKFLQSVCKDKDMDFKKIMEQYKDFTYKFDDELQRDFDEQYNFKTNIRGLKVRGTYSTREEADRRAKKLQGVDSDFHVFVGQVGYWLPWDPCADKIEDEEFVNSQLNDMMGKYKENTINKDIFYEEQKRDKVKAAREEVIRKKKEEAEAKQKKLEEEKNADISEPVKEEEDDIKEIETEVEEIVEEVKDDVDDDLKKSLEEVDPWMANKMKEGEVRNEEEKKKEEEEEVKEEDKKQE